MKEKVGIVHGADLWVDRYGNKPLFPNAFYALNGLNYEKESK